MGLWLVALLKATRPTASWAHLDTFFTVNRYFVTVNRYFVTVNQPIATEHVVLDNVLLVVWSQQCVVCKRLFFDTMIVCKRLFFDTNACMQKSVYWCLYVRDCFLVPMLVCTRMFFGTGTCMQEVVYRCLYARGCLQMLVCKRLFMLPMLVWKTPRTHGEH
jgi:hypothetical protein